MIDNLIMELILKYARGSVLSHEERRILHEWGNASPDNQVLLQSFGDQEWLEERLKEMEAIPSQRMWSAIRQRIGASTEAPVKKSSLPHFIAGSLGIVALLAVLFIHPSLLRRVDPPPASAPPSSTVTAEVSVAQYRQKGPVDIILPDSSSVKLSYGSRLSYPKQFTGSSREVYLVGEASFKIAKQSGHPFIVHAGQATVQVLGTLFNVRAYQGEPDAVTLVNGAVRVSDSAGRVTRTMKPAEQAIVDKGEVRILPCEHPEESLSWSNTVPEFYFHNTDVHTAVKELARWYDMEVVDNLSGPGMPITGNLRMHDSLDLTLINCLEGKIAHVGCHGRQLILRGPVMH